VSGVTERSRNHMRDIADGLRTAGLLAAAAAVGCVGGMPTVSDAEFARMERRAVAQARLKQQAAEADPADAGMRRRPGFAASPTTLPAPAFSPSAAPTGAAPTGAAPTAPVQTAPAFGPKPAALPFTLLPATTAAAAAPNGTPGSTPPSALPPIGEGAKPPPDVPPVPVPPGAPDLVSSPITKEELLKLDTSSPVLKAYPVLRLSLQEAVARALANSHQIRVAAYEPAIRATEILEAEGLFDTVLFARGDGLSEATGFNGILYRNRDQPLGQPFGFGGVALAGGGGGTRGGVNDDQQQGRPGLLQQEFAYRFGARQLLPTGTLLQVSQRMSHLETNNPFTNPNPQSTASISFSIRQPILRGAGLDYNRAPIFIGVNNKAIGTEEFRRQVILHLANVENAYWNLVLSRYTLVIQERLLEQQIRAATFLERRRNDVLEYIRDRAVASVEAARAAVLRARATVRDNQDRLKVLLNDPALPIRAEVEIIPTDPLSQAVTVIDEPVRAAALAAALRNRPEIRQARLEIKNAAVREGIARNELLPLLDIVAETVPQGLRGQISTAFRDQWKFAFQDWLFGLSLEVPVANRTARARHQRTQLIRDQFTEQLSLTIQNVYLDVTLALHNLESIQGEVVSRRAALEAAAAELAARTAVIAQGVPREGIPVALDLLIQSQDRLAIQAFQLYSSQVDYATGVVRLEQAKGTLLYYDNVELEEEPFRLPVPAGFPDPVGVKAPVAPPPAPPAGR
jgi:outer membrane protein TolC